MASVHVQKYTKTTEGHTEFFLKVSYLGREWGIHKRYSDFLHFDDYLKAMGIIVPYELPPKTWWNRFDSTLLAARLKALQGYMNVLLGSVILGEVAVVREFLEVDTIVVKDLIKKRSFREFGYQDRLKAIVADTNRLPCSSRHFYFCFCSSFHSTLSMLSSHIIMIN